MKFVVTFSTLVDHKFTFVNKVLEEKNMMHACRRAIKMASKMEGDWEANLIEQADGKGKSHNVSNYFVNQVKKSNPEVELS
jgi:hypothetical protein